jgi:tRNA(Ile)-lysidine synthase
MSGADHDPLQESIATIPQGRWGIGVSGGADSVALLHLLARHRPDLSVHVIHLDHQTRGEASTGDAQFVQQLCAAMNVPSTIARRDQIEPMLRNPPANPSALYRQLRLALFRNVADEHKLQGVILAHHADDQAETVLHRLLRGSGYAGLAGMSASTTVNYLLILRPLLRVRRSVLRSFLTQHDLPWREDQSNASPKYLRNRLRRLLAATPESMTEALLGLAQSCAALRDWARLNAPVLDDRVAAATLARLPRILAHESARRWLLEQGMPMDQLQPAVMERVLTMAEDAASGPRQDLPGRMRLRRRGGMLFIEPGH